MNRAYLLTGGNIGDREDRLREAAGLIDLHCGHILRSSSIYETAAWGNEQQESFLNQAHEIETTLHARQLIRKVLKVEKQMGRIRTQKYAPRVIDVDILLFNDEIHEYPLLRLPHPELHNRRFALVPLAELAPSLVHPVFHKTVSELLETCPDKLPVTRFT